MVFDPIAERTARARILDAALLRFADDGIAGTSVKAIAEDVGVSAPLVIHHFGSKRGLREACDAYVAGIINDRKTKAMAAGSSLDPLAALREARDGPPVLRYLARSLTETSTHAAELIDGMVDDAVAYLAQGVESGLLNPSDFPRERAVLLVMWNLGSLVLHEHVQRLLGVDLTNDDGSQLMPWALPALEIYAKGLFAQDVYDGWRDSLNNNAESRDQEQGEQP